MAGLFDDIPVSAVTPTQRAFLSGIAAGESPGYNVIYGGQTFDNYADHPRKAVPIVSGPNAGRTSSAAGRYQFLGSTWDEAKNALGLPDFSPQSQDRAAVWLAGRDYKKRTGRDLWADVEAASGDPAKLNEIGSSLSGTWTSLPGGIERNNATGGFGQRVATELSGQSRAAAGLFDDIPVAPATSRPKIVINRPQTDYGQRLLLETENELSAASQRTTPSIAAHQKNLISDEAFEGDDGNLYFKDPITGQIVPTDRNKHVAIRDPQDNVVKIFARTEQTDEGLLSAAGRVVRIGAISGSPTRLAGGVAEKSIPALVQNHVPEGQLVAEAGERLGVTLPRAVTSDSTRVQQSGKIAANVPGAGIPLVQASRTAIEQLNDAADAIQAAYGVGSIPLAGAAARRGLEGALKPGDAAADMAALALHGGQQTRDIWRSLPMASRVDALYRRVDELINPATVAPLVNTRGAVQVIANRRTQAALPASDEVKTLLDGLARDGMTYDGVKRLREHFGEMLRNSSLVPKGMGEAEIKQIYASLSKDLRLVIAKAGGDDALRAHDKAERVFKRWADIRSDLAGLLRASSDEAIFDRIAATAGSTSRADLKLLGRARAAVGAENWDEIAAGVISRLGRDPDGNFSPDRFLTGYGKLSEGGKALLFRTKNHATHADALDDIAAISRRFKQLNEFSNPSGTARGMMGGGMAVGIWADPLTTIVSFTSAGVVSTILARPASARSAAAWSRAYERAVKNPTAGAIEGFRQASKLFATNVGREMGNPELIPNLTRQLQGAIGARTEDE